MKTRRRYTSILQCCAVGYALLLVQNTFAHGGVVLEDDLCIIKVGFYQAHFTIFQPRAQRHEQFCEDLPDVGESVFVLEYLHDGLESLPVDFRIIKNTTNMGQFAGLEDVEAVQNLEEITVLYQPPVREPDVITVLHNFEQAGEFIGIVSTINPDTNVTYTAVFPFEVGFVGINYSAAAFICVFAAVFFYWLFFARRRHQAAAAPLLVLGLTFAAESPAESAAEAIVYVSRGDHFKITIESSLNPISINQIHNWQVRITDKDGSAVADATLTLIGGMPEHDHGLPTHPKMTNYLGDGTYLIQGMKFHMRGAWELQLDIETPTGSDRAIIPLNL